MELTREAAILFATAVLSVLFVVLTWIEQSVILAAIGIATLTFIGYTYREYVE